MNETEATPKFSVIIATKNGGAVLGSCLASLTEQSFRSFEVVVKDCLSDDSTADVIRRAREKLGERLVFLTARDSGISEAWNQALAATSGEWVYILGADDALHSDESFAVVAELINRNENLSADLLYGGVEYVNGYGHSLGVWAPGMVEVGRRLPVEMPFSHQGLFARGELARRIKFDKRWKFSADYDFVVRAVMMHGAEIQPLATNPPLVARVGVGGISGMPQNATRVLCEYRQIQRGLGMRPRLRCVWLATKASVKLFAYRALGARVGAFVVDIYRLMTLRSARHSWIAKAGGAHGEHVNGSRSKNF